MFEKGDVITKRFAEYRISDILSDGTLVVFRRVETQTIDPYDYDIKRWFHFRVHHIFQDGEMDINIDRVSCPEDDAVNPMLIRKLSRNVYDLPGDGGCIWEGYVRSADEDSAREAVRKNY